ncbi:MAG: DNA-directed RNA polymerase subunit D [Thermoplasmata archaeon HGW-Thermoplasmata-2]|nr:MAG: DNA-directed RNA polymerase subunit D [Thermoplasmata archaeon HGW-Thermoplasmata-2]
MTAARPRADEGDEECKHIGMSSEVIGTLRSLDARYCSLATGVFYMKIEPREISENSMRFVIRDTTPAFANMIRRALVVSVPKLAIDDVMIYDNTSALFDEIIAHKLGMLPIPTAPEEFVEKEKCTCNGEGCSKCTVHYTLSKEGPCTIHSGDLTPDRPGFAFADKQVPIVKLLGGQRLILEAIATLGTGSKHAKWQVSCGAGYKYYPSVKIDQSKCDYHGGCIKECPQGIFKMDGKKVVVDQSKIEKCTLCMSCKEYCEEASSAIDVTWDENKVIFTFETDGSLPAAEALRHATKSLKQKFAEFESLI